MSPEDHWAKALRIERSRLAKLDLDKDYELVVWSCMQGGAHLLNAAGTHALNLILHRLGLTAEGSDLVHSDIPAHEIPMPPELVPLVAGLKVIEDLRVSSLRGKALWNPVDAPRCLDAFRALRAHVGRVS